MRCVLSVVCFGACFASALALTTDGTMSNTEQQNWEEVNQTIRKLIARIKELEDRLAFLEEHSAEASAARAKLTEKAKAEADRQSAAADERLRLNRILKVVSENGQFMTMASGMVLQVHTRSQAYTRRWKSDAMVNKVAQSDDQTGWFWIENAGAPKSEQRALVRIME